MRRMISKALIISLVLFVVVISSSSLLGADGRSVTVFAAASTTNAITDVAKLFSEKGLGRVVTSFAASSTLARQIENGARRIFFCPLTSRG